MRRLWSILFTLWLANGAAAQSPGNWDVYADDPVGDVQVRGPMPGVGAPIGEVDHADIIGVGIGNETLEHLTIGVRFASLDSPTPTPILLQQGFHVAFNIGRQAYRATYPSACPQGVLEKLEPDGSYRALECVTVETLPTEGMRVMVLGKRHLTDDDGAPLRKGTAITNFTAQSRSILVPVPQTAPPQGLASPGSIVASDIAPPTPLTYFGNQGARDGMRIRLAADIPVRASNGEESRFLFLVRVENFGSASETVALAAGGIPNQWEAAYPPTVLVPAGQSRMVPLLIFKSMAHRHAETIPFMLQATTSSGDNASIELAISYLEIPQPTGHHPTVYLHSGRRATSPDDLPVLDDGGPALWMNAAQPDPSPATTDEAAPARFSEMAMDPDGSPVQDWYWTAPLSPSLQSGLAFRENASVLFAPAIALPGMVERSSLNATLYYCTGSAAFTPAARNACPKDGMALASVRMDDYVPGTRLEAAMPPGLTLLPFAPETNLVLQLLLTTSPWSSPGEPPLLDVANSWISLPLIEYVDPLDAYQVPGVECQLTPGASIGLRPAKPKELSLSCTSNDDKRASLVLLGGRGWFTLQEPSTLEFRAGQPARGTLVVVAPPDSDSGETADAALAIFDEDGQLRFVQSITAMVEGSESISQPAKGTPAPAIWAVAMLLLAYAVVRRQGLRDT